MASIEWPGDILLISAVATVGFTLLSYWFSAVMSKRGWSWQIRSKPKRRS